MGNFINRGKSGFEETRNGEYVDKSGLIAFVNKRLKTKYKFLCVTRARRFGKTTTAEMLCAYYDKSCDSHELFDDLEISTNPNLNGMYLTHLNKYPTIYIDMTRFVSRKIKLGKDIVSKAEVEIAEDIIGAYPEISFGDISSLGDVLLKIFEKKNEHFFFIMDEWDAILREYNEDSGVMTGWIDFLRGLFKDTTVSKVFAGVYITGILPIIKYNTQSALNNFREYNMVQAKGLQQYFGFTEGEVESLCKAHCMDYDMMKSWYDGYRLGSLCSVFNPNSVMEAIDSGEYGNYWTTTGAGDELAPYLKLDLYEDVKRMLAGESVPVNISSFQNRMDDLGTKDKVLTALIHLGYLSYGGGKASIPNTELMLYFADCVTNAEFGGLSRVVLNSKELLDRIIQGDSGKVAELIEFSHNDICGMMEYNNDQSLFATLIVSLAYARADYNLHREFPSGKGFADLVLIPHNRHKDPGIVIELKWNRSAEGAIAQIKERSYAQKIFGYADEVILVGINYDKSTKEHSCKIEKVSKS